MHFCFCILFSVQEAAVSSYAADDTIKIDLWMNQFCSPNTLEIKTKLRFVVLGTKSFCLILLFILNFFGETMEFDMTKHFPNEKAKVRGSE